MFLHRLIVLATFALCFLAILRLLSVGMWNESALLAIILAAFMLDRAHVLDKSEDDDADGTA